MLEDSMVLGVAGLVMEEPKKRSSLVSILQIGSVYEGQNQEFPQAREQRTTSEEEKSESGRAYAVVEQPIKQPRPMRVVSVGAGIAGLALLYKTKQVAEIEVEVYEKFPDVGGVWLQNRYPGCSCDIPAHIYCYSFEGNPNWSQ
jgi:hypothetical protein